MIFIDSFRYFLFNIYSKHILSSTKSDKTAKYTARKLLGINYVEKDLWEYLRKEIVNGKLYDKPYKIIGRDTKNTYKVLTSGSTGNPKEIIKNQADTNRTSNLLVNALWCSLKQHDRIKEFFHVWKKVSKLEGKIIVVSGVPNTPLAVSYHIQKHVLGAYEKLLGVSVEINFISDFKELDAILKKYSGKITFVTGAWHIARHIIFKGLEYNTYPFIIGTGGEPVPVNDLEKIYSEVSSKLEDKGLKLYIEYVYASSEFYIGDAIKPVEKAIDESKKYKSSSIIIEIPLNYTIIHGLPSIVKNADLIDKSREWIKKEILSDTSLLENKLFSNYEEMIGNRVFAIMTPLFSKLDGEPITIYMNYVGLWDTFEVKDLEFIHGRPVLLISDITRAGGFVKIGNALVDPYKLSYDLENSLKTLVRLRIMGEENIYTKLIVEVLVSNNTVDKSMIENKIMDVIKKYLALHHELSRGTVTMDVELKRELPNDKWIKCVRKREQ